MTLPQSSPATCKEMEKLESYLSKAKGLVFDCDGTLLDTMPIYYESWKRACDELGLSFPIERFYAFAGATVQDIFQTLLQEQMPSSTIDTNNTSDDVGRKMELTSSYCESVKRKHHQQIEAEGRKAGPIDVVVEIAWNHHRKIPMAVASSGWRDHVMEGLERVGILHLFDTVVTACDEEVTKPKPHPDIFLVAAKRMNLDPKDCIGFEDADFGMQALQAAGYLYACDVRLFYMYPRNIERRLSSQISNNDDSIDVKESSI